MKRNGFTLIELILVMAILAMLMGLGASTFTSSLKKSHDASRKGNLRAIATALEYYFNDTGYYPEDDGAGGIKGCGIGPATCVPGQPWVDANGTLYMPTLPKDPSPSQAFYYRRPVTPANDQFQLYARLENTQDSQLITPVYTCNSPSNPVVSCNWGVSSANITP